VTAKRYVLKVGTTTYNELRGLLGDLGKFEVADHKHVSYMPDFVMGEFIIRHNVQLDDRDPKSRPLEEGL
jgi:hypothetical protein